MKDEEAGTVWEAGWDGHELLQRRRLARLSLAEKIQWLEEAQGLVQHLKQQPRSDARAPRTTRQL